MRLALLPALDQSISELSGEARVKLEVIQSLIEPCDRATYGERLREGAKTLGVSVQSVQQLFKKYQEEGLAALTSTNRGDKGKQVIAIAGERDVS